MIKVKKLSKRFGRQVVLNQIDLTIREGELLVILGESGSGKSVLLQHLIGLMKPDQGSVEVLGQDITNMPERELLGLRKKMGYLFQEGALYDFMTVFENVAFPLREHSSLSRGEIKKKVEGMLAVVGLSEAAGKLPSQLSGGMKKRAALARSVIMDSQILFCDEPTSGLDPIKSRQISELIKDLSSRIKCTTVVTSHDIANSLRIADRLILIKDGGIAAQGTPQEIQTSHDEYLQKFFS